MLMAEALDLERMALSGRPVLLARGLSTPSLAEGNVVSGSRELLAFREGRQASAADAGRPLRHGTGRRHRHARRPVERPALPRRQLAAGHGIRDGRSGCVARRPRAAAADTPFRRRSRFSLVARRSAHRVHHARRPGSLRALGLRRRRCAHRRDRPVRQDRERLVAGRTADDLRADRRRDETGSLVDSSLGRHTDAAAQDRVQRGAGADLSGRPLDGLRYRAVRHGRGVGTAIPADGRATTGVGWRRRPAPMAVRSVRTLLLVARSRADGGRRSWRRAALVRFATRGCFTRRSWVASPTHATRTP